MEPEPGKTRAFDAPYPTGSASVASDRAGTRTQDQRTNLLQGGRPIALGSKQLRIHCAHVAACLPCDRRQTDPRLSTVVSAWSPPLEVVKAGIMAMVEACKTSV